MAEWLGNGEHMALISCLHINVRCIMLGSSEIEGYYYYYYRRIAHVIWYLLQIGLCVLNLIRSLIFVWYVLHIIIVIVSVVKLRIWGGWIVPLWCMVVGRVGPNMSNVGREDPLWKFWNSHHCKEGNHASLFILTLCDVLIL